ncbi:E3 ubiquitin-protein ligase RNF217 [Astyanax mexicanus]|uniref:E3 ubiquitin-protein ligase RNF217 n=1 Tax=Astyanax mexicanus TaxID=7994 RepID=UPI0020CB288A|nr:E3 ubiquitin-protein ligase RNF217 [Astyanax mexicanus]
MSTVKCPECKASDARVLSGQCATCPHCCKTKRRVFKFCTACQREWPKSVSNDEACKLSKCAVRAALLSSECIDIPSSSVEGCPYFRACPSCKMLLTHTGMGCPNIICPQCETEFCFYCLNEECDGECTLVDNSRSLRELEM